MLSEAPTILVLFLIFVQRRKIYEVVFTMKPASQLDIVYEKETKTSHNTPPSGLADAVWYLGFKKYIYISHWWACGTTPGKKGEKHCKPKML
jgi:hypothetical protein